MLENCPKGAQLSPNYLFNCLPGVVSRHRVSGWIISDEYSEKSRESERWSMHSRADRRMTMGVSAMSKSATI